MVLSRRIFRGGYPVEPPLGHAVAYATMANPMETTVLQLWGARRNQYVLGHTGAPWGTHWRAPWDAIRYTIAHIRLMAFTMMRHTIGCHGLTRGVSNHSRECGSPNPSRFRPVAPTGPYRSRPDIVPRHLFRLPSLNLHDLIYRRPRQSHTC